MARTDITYSIVLRYENLEKDYISLTAGTDRGAFRQARQYLSEHPLSPGTQMFVEFARSTDGQVGYLNQDGNAAITGEAWS